MSEFGENSPNLWPTMFSVTSTGTNFLPLWTPNVRPTNCGMIVDRRDHVRITSLRFDPRTCSAFFNK